jgi:DNA-binding NtrC family response regulator
VDALITQGTALARLGKQEHAKFILQKAYETAIEVGAFPKAGLASLVLIEEIPQLSPSQLQVAYSRAHEWLSKSEEQEILLRLSGAAGKLVSAVLSDDSGALSAEQATEILLSLNQLCDLQKEMLKYEGQVIRQALTKANGSLTRAAAMLSMSYQALAYVLDSRHRELLKERTPIHRRAKKTQ